MNIHKSTKLLPHHRQAIWTAYTKNKEMVHVDTKRLPLLKGQKSNDAREYLFVGIDDFSRKLYAAMYAR